jgi:hypothetical protein
MKYVVIFLGLLMIVVPSFGKKYLGDTTLSSKKFDQVSILGVANLDVVSAKEISITGLMVDLKATRNRALEVYAGVR